MNPVEVRDRLGDRFRLLSGSRRGFERHQTLHHAVHWSYELLDENEQTLLNRCSVFAGGFDLPAAVEVCGDGLDEYVVLDLLDSLVRKSLVTIEQVLSHTRYGLLETIRQFAEEQLASTATITEVRDRHARFFADQAVAHWAIWDGPRQRVALDWVDVELANLRAGFRWATGQGDLVTATAIAAHTAMIAQVLQRFEPVGWAEEILETATAADLAQLPRLYAAASLCAWTGRAEAGVGYAQRAVALEADSRYDSITDGWSRCWEANAYRFAGQLDRGVEIAADVANQPGPGRILGLAGLLNYLPVIGRAEKAMAIAEEAVGAARAYGNPFWIAVALSGYGRAYVEADPARALRALREALLFSQEHRLSLIEGGIARDAAVLEAIHGELEEALSLFDTAIDSLHRAGSVAHLAETLGSLAVFFDRLARPEVAATVYGTTTHYGTGFVTSLPSAVARVRTVLGEAAFDECTATGAAMELADAVAYAHRQIQLARDQLTDPT
jgi:tetratricopeptide (TPR) repeat protein